MNKLDVYAKLAVAVKSSIVLFFTDAMNAVVLHEGRMKNYTEIHCSKSSAINTLPSAC